MSEIRDILFTCPSCKRSGTVGDIGRWVKCQCGYKGDHPALIAHRRARTHDVPKEGK